MTTALAWGAKPDPRMPPDYDDDVVRAVRALFTGTASASQQLYAVRWLMYVTAASEEFQDLSFRIGTDGERMTAFAEGKRFVGMQIRKMLRPEVTPKPAVEKQKIEAAAAKGRRARRAAARQNAT